MTYISTKTMRNVLAQNEIDSTSEAVAAASVLTLMNGTTTTLDILIGKALDEMPNNPGKFLNATLPAKVLSTGFGLITGLMSNGISGSDRLIIDSVSDLAISAGLGLVGTGAVAVATALGATIASPAIVATAIAVGLGVGLDSVGVLDPIKNNIGDFIEGSGKAIGDAWDGMTDAVGGAAEAVQDWGGQRLKDLAEAVEKAPAKAAELIDDFKKGYEAAKKKLADAADNAVRDLGLGQDLDDLVGKVTEKLKELSDALPKNPDEALEKLGEGLKNLGDAVGDATGKVGDWLEGLRDWFEQAIEDSIPRLRDPIVLDLNGDGVQLVSRADANVRFDFDNDGFAESSGWLSAQDGFLAADWNGDGKINNVTELFGDEFTSGFDAMAALDTNGDSVLDATDAQWRKLRVWQDANSNGQTDAGELLRLSTFNISSIDLNFTTVNFDAEANLISEKGVYTTDNGKSFEIADVWFDFDNVNSRSLSVGSVSDGIKALPNLRGYGDIADLHVAMENDAALARRVKKLMEITPDQIIEASGLIEEIVFRWLGTFNEDRNGRGENFDGRVLATLEVITGTPFDANGVTNPPAEAVAALTGAWQSVVNSAAARLLLQGPFAGVLSGLTYSVETDTLYMVGSAETMLADLAAIAPEGDGADQIAFFATVLSLVESVGADNGFDLESPEFVALREDLLEPLGMVGNTFVDLVTEVRVLGGAAPVVEAHNIRGVSVYGEFDDDITLIGTNEKAVFGNGGDDRMYAGSAGASVMNGGEGDDTLRGGRYNDWLDGGAGHDLLLGGAGNDTYVVDSASDVIIETLYGGTDTVRAHINFSLDWSLENLTLLGAANLNGKGNDNANRIIGNAGNNELYGYAGRDHLDGGLGADTMTGGSDDDSYVVDSQGDQVVERRDGGTDHVFASITFTLGRNLENLTLTGESDLHATGNRYNNSIYGNDGDNRLDGGAGGYDRLYGGLGDDVYILRSGGTASDVADGGHDIVRAFFSTSLGAYIEDLVLVGGDDIDGTGNELSNKITGNGSANRLDGRVGADTMIGGGGDDVYVVDDSGDSVVELDGEGRDQVFSSISISMFANTEVLTLTGYEAINASGSRSADEINGNSYDNTISGNRGSDILRGNSGSDSLVGGTGNDSLFGGNDDDVLKGGNGNDLLDGGTGADRMVGGVGNDTYIVDNLKDRIVERKGVDTVNAMIDFTLGKGVENLVLLETSNARAGVGNGGRNDLTGNRYDNVLDGKVGADTMSGLAGNDVYYVDNAGDVVAEHENAGTDTVIASVDYTLGENVEHLTLTGEAHIDGTGNAASNVINGNGGRNTLTGNDGNDTLDGGLLADRMIGGTGNDIYYVDHSKDVVVEKLGEGTDTVYSGVNFKMEDVIEVLYLTGSGNLRGYGGAFDSTIHGNDGNNRLDGGSGGRNTLYGGRGNDTYVARTAATYGYESADAGIDEWITYFSTTLGANFERLRLQGDENLDGTGNALDNRIQGNSGDNTLNGAAGADRMIGRAGDDTYVVDNIGDVIVEKSNQGVDLVRSSVSFVLGANIEDLELTGNGAIDGTGNSEDNVILGTGAANRLTGGNGSDSLRGYAGNDALNGGNGSDILDGGVGDDTMAGGSGNDIYYVDSSSDEVVELTGEGTDEVISTVSYLLDANVEILRLSGNGTLDAGGNALDNTIWGNGANNVLDGKAGADLLIGGGGNDIYLVDNIRDVVIELYGEGLDEVRSTVNFSLDEEIERLTLFGSKSIDGTGNRLANTLTGNSAANTLRGIGGDDILNGEAGADTLIGGLGRDTLDGGLGHDTFVFETAKDSASGYYDADWINNFSVLGSDKIDLSLIDGDVSVAGVQELVFIEDRAFSSAGQIRFEANGSSATSILINLDADINTIEMRINLDRAYSLTAQDFIL